jgi:[ribosomal protein S18]-alanine N-acetyltransferase
VRIRPLRNGDMPAVFAIEQVVFPDDSWTDEMFASELAQPQTRHYIVAEDDGVLVGYGGLSIVGGHQGDVQTLAVRADRQGEGIGRALLTELVAVAEARGCKEVFLDVRVDNDRARSLYQRTGFTEIGVRRGYYQPSGADAVVMCVQVARFSGGASGGASGKAQPP